MYLDPGFGGMLIQIVIALVAAGGAVLFAMRKKLRELFSKNKAVKNPIQEPKSANESQDDVIDMLSDDK